MRTRNAAPGPSLARNLLALGSMCGLLALAMAPPASAQYMYLDSNGDGINTAEDQVQADGPTHITIWLDTGRDRDGTPVSCNSHTGEPANTSGLEMFSYDFVLTVSDRDVNSVTWRAWADSLGFSNDLGTQSSPIYLDISRFADVGTRLPQGRYMLGSVDMVVAAGAPAINIVPFIDIPNPPSNNFTGFGTLCDATIFPNTYFLSRDWFDTDGLAASSTVVTPFPARIYTTNAGDTFRLNSGKPTLCLQIEPIGESFDLGSVEPQTITMLSHGTGVVDQILGTTEKTVVGGDRDRNGIPEIRACFARSDLLMLFSGVRGRRDVPITVEGRLQSGKIFRGTATLAVIGDRVALHASVSPNPLNPEATLRLVTESPGPLHVRVFDVSGRLVRELANEQDVAAGEHRIRIDGRAQDGTKLASGIYLFRAETRDEVTVGRFAILR